MTHFLARGGSPARLPLSPRAVLPIRDRSGLISGKSTASESPTDVSHAVRCRTAKRTARRLGEIANAAREIGSLPDPDESIHLIMHGSYHGWSAVGAILNLARPATIVELVVATLGFNTANARELFGLLDSHQVQTVRFVASCYFEKSCPQEYRLLRDGLLERGQHCAALRTHAKVIGARMTDGRSFVIETSANLRSCRNIEQLTLFQNADLFDFHAEWISQAINTCHGNGPPAKPL